MSALRAVAGCALWFAANAACAVFQDHTARQFKADPAAAPPAIERALGAAAVGAAKVDVDARRIESEWVGTFEGASRSRHRYIVKWAKDPKTGQLEITVRQEAQDQDIFDGALKWGAIYHDDAREMWLLDQIGEALEARARPAKKAGRKR